MRIYLDDERSPKSNRFLVVRTYEGFCLALSCATKITEVSFDHDLGAEKTGMDCLRYMVEEDMKRNGTLFSTDLIWNAHTANPCGRDNMNSYIKSYLKFKEGEQNAKG